MSFSKYISIILHPLLMPFTAVYLSFVLVPTIGFAIANYINFIFTVLILCTIIMPLISLIILIKLRLVSSLEISEHKERPLPLLISGMWLLIGYYIIDDLLVFTPLIKVEILAAIIIVFLASIISKYWKISLHMLAAGGVVGVLILLSVLFGVPIFALAISVLASGCLGVARLNENAHDHKQVYSGFLLGLVAELCTGLLLI